MILLTVTAAIILLYTLNCISYVFQKGSLLRRHVWDLNICCGATDGGGVNADVVRHANVRNFVLIEDINRLPFVDNVFASTLCSHTMEHVENPRAFSAELERVSRNVVYLVPPLWDVGAVLNVLEHKWIFLTLRTEHRTLPPHVRLPFAALVQNYLGQTIKA